MQSTISKLYEFIAKLVLDLEQELLSIEPGKKNTKARKNMTDSIKNLVQVIIQLNKVSKDLANNHDSQMLSGEDKEIIARFLERYKNAK